MHRTAMLANDFTTLPNVAPCNRQRPVASLHREMDATAGERKARLPRCRDAARARPSIRTLMKLPHTPTLAA
eukprot:4129730-Amphidinium_carterae.1